MFTLSDEDKRRKCIELIEACVCAIKERAEKAKFSNDVENTNNVCTLSFLTSESNVHKNTISSTTECLTPEVNSGEYMFINNEYNDIYINVLERHLYDVYKDKVKMEEELDKAKEELNQCWQIIQNCNKEQTEMYTKNQNCAHHTPNSTHIFTARLPERHQAKTVSNCYLTEPDNSGEVLITDNSKTTLPESAISLNETSRVCENMTNKTKRKVYSSSSLSPSRLISHELYKTDESDKANAINNWNTHAEAASNKYNDKPHLLQDVVVNCENNCNALQRSSKMKSQSTDETLNEILRADNNKEMNYTSTTAINVSCTNPLNESELYEHEERQQFQQTNEESVEQFSRQMENESNMNRCNDICMSQGNNEWAETEACLNSTFTSEVSSHARLTSFTFNGAQEEMLYSNRTTPPPRQTVLLDSDVVSLFDNVNVSMDCKRRLQSLLLE